jgi:type VI secretion system protein ImpL
MWIWLISILIVVADWVGGTLLGWPLWLEILISVLAVLLIVAWFVGRRVRGLLKARAIERDMMKQAQQQAMNARPDRRAEILDLQAQMQRGLEALRRAPHGGGASALFRLPWYMIVGPPGAGKTTALRQSGLAFPALDPRGGGGMRGIGGTRNCDWWFTNEAILLDTAGRYATEVDDYDEWTAFLDTLKRYRSAKPINGVLVAISVTDLAEAREDQVDTMAKGLRARIDEIATRLQMLVPVYVMFTKVDLIAGFVEMWGDLRKSERGQIWGVTFPLAGAERRDPGKAFEPEMDLLIEALHTRALRRVGSERQPELRPRIYQFPLEVAALKRNLVEFVASLLQPNTYRDTPILRGVYFTSGTQEGRPIDRVIGQMLQAFNLAPPVAAPQYGQPAAYGQSQYGQQPQYGQPPPPPQYGQPQTDSKSYFVTDLFRRVVFPDQHVAARTQGEARRQLVNRIVFSMVALLVAVCGVLPSLYTFGRNMSLVSETRDIGARAKRIDWHDATPPLEKVRALDDLRNQVELLEGWRDRGVPMGMGWGMYAGSSLLEPLRNVYMVSLQLAFVQPTKAQLEHELAPAAGQTRSSIEQYGAYFARLKAYLSMADPQRVQDDDGDREITALTDVWARTIGVTSSPDKAVLRPHVEEYVHMVARGLAPPWNAEGMLVARVRAVLAQTSRVDRDYSALVHDANENAAPITRAYVFRGASFAEYVTSKSSPEVNIAGAFTRSGWESYVRDALDERRAKKLAHDRWVLGESEEKGVQEILAGLKQLETRYFNEYRDAWAGFVKDLQFRKPENDAAALKELSSASETPWPMLMLLQTMAENTRLQPSPDSPLLNDVRNRLTNTVQSAEQRAQTAIGDAGAVPVTPKTKRWMSPVEEAFAPMVTFGVPPDMTTAGGTTELAHYVEKIVAALVGVLTDLHDAPINRPDAKTVTLAYATAQRATGELIDSAQTAFTRPLLAPLLLAPVQK